MSDSIRVRLLLRDISFPEHEKASDYNETRLTVILLILKVNFINYNVEKRIGTLFLDICTLFKIIIEIVVK